MANIFKAKTLLGKSGIFSQEVVAPNLVYNTGDQNISGNKTFSDSISAKYLSGISGEDLGINCPPNSGGQGSSIRIRGGDGTNGAGTITLDAGVYYNPTPGVPNSQAALYFNAGAVYFNSVPYPKDWAARGGMIIYKSGYVFGDSVVPIAQFITSDVGGVTVLDKFTVTGSSIYTDQAIYISGNPVLTGINLSAYPNQLVYTTGDQTISGNKSFINNIEVQGTGIFNAVDLSNISEFQFSGTNINLVDSNVYVSGGSIYISGNSVITGVNLSNYYTNNNPSGFINQLPSTIVYTTGDQIISGDKNFADKLIAKTGFFGKNNLIYGEWSTIGNGEENIIYSNYSIIGGGRYNFITGESGVYNSILGGINNLITGDSNTLLGGTGNLIVGTGNLIGGGSENYIIDDSIYGTPGNSIILAGRQNYINGIESAILGGCRNCIHLGDAIIQGSTIIAGQSHDIFSSYATIIAGYRNEVSGQYGIVGGGCDLCIIASFNNGIFAGASNCILGGSASSIIGGGASNRIYDSNISFIGGGRDNTIIAQDDGTSPYFGTDRGYSSIVGGRLNKISGSFASILGGRDNVVSGDYGYILGGRCAAILETHSGAAVLADGQDRFHPSYSPHSLTIDFASGINIASSVTGTLNPNGIANYLEMNINSQTYYIPMYTGTFTAI